MKTIRMGTPRTRNTWTMLLMAALGGLYYYRRNGGSVRNIASTVFSKLGSLRGVIDRVAPSVASHIPASRGHSGVGTAVGSKTTTTKRKFDTSSYQLSV